MEWNKVSEVEIPFGEEVIAFNEKWIDECQKCGRIKNYIG